MKYTKNDDIVCLYIYLFGGIKQNYFYKELNITNIELSKILNKEWTSIKMRIENFIFIDNKNYKVKQSNKKGLSHYSKLSEKVYYEYYKKSKIEFRCKFVEIIKSLEIININNF